MGILAAGPLVPTPKGIRRPPTLDGPRRRAHGLVLAAALLGSLLIGQAARAQASASPQLTDEEVAQGWISLFDGETTFGWEPTSKADWKVVDGELRVASGAPGFLATTSEFADYELHAEFRGSPQTNSGIFLRTPLAPSDPSRDCYELNIADPSESPFPTGSLVGRAKAAPVPADQQWHSLDVTCQGPRIRIRLDDREVLDYTDPAPLGRGRISLQYRQGPVAFRKVRLRPLGLVPMFNDHDLSGWRVFPDKASEFSRTPEGELRIRNGNGQLESEGRYADFVLQLEVKVNARGLNSGVFFRCIPGEFWQGYESQIHNGYLRQNRAEPADFGTGGFYRREKARRVVADDGVWFAKTLVVSGPHMAAWVNGYQVSDWTDPRPPNPNPRQGLRLEAGTLALQGHDPTTDLLFRGLRIVEMAERGGRPPK